MRRILKYEDKIGSYYKERWFIKYEKEYSSGITENLGNTFSHIYLNSTSNSYAVFNNSFFCEDHKMISKTIKGLDL